MTAARIALVWENFGPSHFDRIGACVAAGFEVTAIEFNAASGAYRWEAGDVPGARRVTLGQPGRPIGGLDLVRKLFGAVRASGAQAVFLCHYQSFAVFAVAVLLRLWGRRVIAMVDSKFDDYPRFLWREVGKAILLAPYNAAMAGSRRSAEYLHFLGLHRRPIRGGFDTLDLARIRALAGAEDGPGHAERDFVIVARLVAKKNLPFALDAYAAWKRQALHPRKLRIVGYGPDEPALRAQAEVLGLAGDVVFEGQADSAQVCRTMRDGLCLILPSVEEQFGLVVIEALALGLPVLVSANAGAVDELVDNGVNGWIVDPRRPAALVAAMSLLDRDEAAWRAARVAASASSERGDVSRFVEAVRSLSGTGQAA